MYVKKFTNGYLAHYNHNHDALGRFASSPGGSFSGKIKYQLKDRKLRSDIKTYQDIKNVHDKSYKINEKRLLNRQLKGKKISEKYIQKYNSKQLVNITTSKGAEDKIKALQSRRMDLLLDNTKNETVTVVDPYSNKIKTHLPEGTKIKNHGMNDVSELTVKRYSFGDSLDGKIKMVKGDSNISIELEDHKMKNGKFLIPKDVIKTVNTISNNKKQIDRDCREAVAKNVESYYKGWANDPSVPKNYGVDSFKKDLKCQDILVGEKWPTVSLWYDDFETYDVFGGHMFEVEYDYKRKKVNSVTMNG